MDNKIEKQEISLMQHIYSTIISLSRKLDKQVNSSDSRLTTRQYMAILAIQCSPNAESSMINIAQKLNTTKQNINQIIPALERKGYVTRSACTNNKRSVSVKVTDAGQKAMLAYSGTGATVMKEFFEDFSKNEMDTLLNLLRKLNNYDGEEYSNIIS